MAKLLGLVTDLFRPKQPPLFYSIEEVAKKLGYPERHVYYLIKQGKIKAVQISLKGGSYRIPKVEVERLARLTPVRSQEDTGQTT